MVVVVATAVAVSSLAVALFARLVQALMMFQVLVALERLAASGTGMSQTVLAVDVFSDEFLSVKYI